MQHNIIGGRCSTFSDGHVAIGCNILTLLTATTYDVLQEGVLRGHEAPPSSRHHYLDSVNFRNVDGSTGPNQKRATIVPFVIFKRKRNLKGERERVGGGRRRAGKRRKEVFFFSGQNLRFAGAAQQSLSTPSPRRRARVWPARLEE